MELSPSLHLAVVTLKEISLLLGSSLLGSSTSTVTLVGETTTMPQSVGRRPTHRHGCSHCPLVRRNEHACLENPSVRAPPVCCGGRPTNACCLQACRVHPRLEGEARVAIHIPVALLGSRVILVTASSLTPLMLPGELSSFFP